MSGGGPTTRKPRPRPCDACRRRKTRCRTEESQGECVLCRFHGQPCTYELDAKSINRTFRGVQSPRFSRSSKARSVVPGTGFEEYDTLPDGTSLLKRTLGLQNSHYGEYLGVNNTLNIQSLDETLCQSSGAASEGLVKIRYVDLQHAFKISADASTPGYDEETATLDAIERLVGGYGRDLVDLYFRLIHPGFPILHKAVFLEKYARSYREFIPPLLATVYLLASGYWGYSDSLASMPKPAIEPLERIALHSLTTSMPRAKLSTVQASLLMSQYQATKPRLDAEGDLGTTAQLVQLVHRLGLHLDPGNWQIPSWEIGLRRRLSWACFVQDKWLAMTQGHPSMINAAMWDVNNLCVHDFEGTDYGDQHTCSDIETGKMIFMNLASLSEILSDVLIELFAPKVQRAIRCNGTTLVQLLERVKPLQIRLKEWCSMLPEALRIETATSMQLSPVGYLQLAYLAIEASIHRQIMLISIQDDSKDPILSSICRSAARERFDNALHFFNKLQASHLASFWYVTSAECAALVHHFGRLLERTASDGLEAAELTKMLKGLRWAFRVHSEAGAMFLKRALSLLAASENTEVMKPYDVSMTTSPSVADSGGAGAPSASSSNGQQQVHPARVQIYGFEDMDATGTLDAYTFGDDAVTWDSGLHVNGWN